MAEVGEQIVKTITWSAGPGCHGGCGVLLHVKDGKLTRVEGNPEHPYNQGRLCPRALALKEYMYHPQRLLHPMKRTGPRGTNTWQRISWDEAFDTIEARMKEIKAKYGAESVIFLQGTGRDVGGWALLLAYSYGSPNWIQGGMAGNSCYHPRLGAMRITQGDYTNPDASQFLPGRYENPEYRVPECIILWGQNPVATCNDGFYGHWIVDQMRRGAKVIVVDPIYTWIASRAAIWLPIRPGTDGALALGLLHVIITEGLYDKEFVEKWTHGFDRLAERVKEYPPRRVSEITWIPEAKIIEAARLFAQSKPAQIQWGVPVDMAPQGAVVANAIIHLWTVTGNVEVPGGMAIARMALDVAPYPMSQEAIAELYGSVMPAEQMAKRIGTDVYPMVKKFHWRAHPEKTMDQMESGKPYPIKGAWLQGNNILVTAANPRRYYEALRKLDFVACVDLFMTPTAMAFADFVLPAVTFAEKEGVRSWFAPLNAMNKAVTVGEAKPDAEINFELAKRFNANLPWKNLRELYDYFLRPAGLTYPELSAKGWTFPEPGHPTRPYHRHEKGLLRKDGKPGFNTPTGKIELYSTIFESWGYDPLPYYEEPVMSPVSRPDLAKEYPLILSTGRRLAAFFHSEHRMIRSLRELEPYPEIEINPKTARSLGIADGDWVWVENPHGKCRRKAKYSNIPPWLVQASHGWWFPEKPAEDLFGMWDVQINLLIPDGLQATCGFGGGQYKSLLCKVYKAESGVEGIYEKEEL